jgi:hypothetical protein
MHHESNPASATPQSLYDLYAPNAAVSGNPMTMRLLTRSAHGSHAPDLEAGTSVEMRPSAGVFVPRMQNRGAGCGSSATPMLSQAPSAARQGKLQQQQQQHVQMAVMAPWVIPDALHSSGPWLLPAADARTIESGGAVPNRAEMGIRNAVRNACLKQKQLIAYQQQKRRLGVSVGDR